MVLGRDAEASSLFGEALALSPNDRQILRYQAATLADLGRDGEAREVYRRYAALTGTGMATIAQFRAFITPLTAANIPTMVAYREHMSAGLRARQGCRRSEESGLVRTNFVTILGEKSRDLVDRLTSTPRRIRASRLRK